MSLIEEYIPFTEYIETETFEVNYIYPFKFNKYITSMICYYAGQEFDYCDCCKDIVEKDLWWCTRCQSETINFKLGKIKIKKCSDCFNFFYPTYQESDRCGTCDIRDKGRCNNCGDYNQIIDQYGNISKDCKCFPKCITCKKGVYLNNKSGYCQQCIPLKHCNKCDNTFFAKESWKKTCISCYRKQ